MFKKIVSFFKDYGWKGLVALILVALGAFVVSLVSSCSSVRAGYTRTRDIQQYDSTYVRYDPVASSRSVFSVSFRSVSRSYEKLPGVSPAAKDIACPFEQ